MADQTSSGKTYALLMNFDPERALMPLNEGNALWDCVTKGRGPKEIDSAVVPFLENWESRPTPYANWPCIRSLRNSYSAKFWPFPFANYKRFVCTTNKRHLASNGHSFGRFTACISKFEFTRCV